MMNVIMDNRIIDKEEELRRLQELVKNLEIQNEELRSERQAILKDKIASKEKKLENCNSPVGQKIENVEVLSDLNLSEDRESWLVESPKVIPHKEEWLQKDIDEPSIRHLKKTLFFKLDDSDSNHNSPRHSLYSPGTTVLSPESPPSQGNFDSRTFVRPKKRQTIMDTQHIFQDYSNQCGKELSQLYQKPSGYLGQSSGSLASEDDDRMSSASDGSYSYKLADVEDVTNVARLQEESLKLPEPRPLNKLTGVRSGFGMPGRIIPVKSGSEGSAGSSQEDLIGLKPRGLQPPRRYFSNYSRESSDLSSPPESPYNSQNNLEYCNGKISGGTRLPANKRYGSETRLPDRGSEEIKPPPRTSRLQMPQTRVNPRLGAPSPARIPVANAQTSEPKQGIKSGLQKPKLKLQQKTHIKPPNDSDWREGCY